MFTTLKYSRMISPVNIQQNSEIIFRIEVRLYFDKDYIFYLFGWYIIRCSEVITEKLTVAQMIAKMSVSHGTKIFISTLIKFQFCENLSTLLEQVKPHSKFNWLLFYLISSVSLETSNAMTRTCITPRIVCVKLNVRQWLTSEHPDVHLCLWWNYRHSITQLQTDWNCGPVDVRAVTGHIIITNADKIKNFTFEVK
jgi:hypothetical protein